MLLICGMDTYMHIAFLNCEIFFLGQLVSLHFACKLHIICFCIWTITKTSHYVVQGVNSYALKHFYVACFLLTHLNYNVILCRLTGCSPFLGDNDAETIENVTVGEYEFPEPDPNEGYDDISDAAKDFISCLIISDPR